MQSTQQLATWFGLQGKTALVTGASSGLGAAFAEALVHAGAKVAIAARRKERLEVLAKRLQTTRECLPIAMDITNLASVTAGLAQVEQALGPIDILINNAGAADYARAEEQSEEAIRKVMEVNVFAAFRLAQQVGSQMIAQKRGGAMVNISSIAGLRGNVIFPTVGYSTSKGAVEGMTRQLALEWAPYGIRVNAIAPGWFPTEINLDPRHGDITPKHKQRMVERIPLGRVGEVNEIQGPLLFLVSPAASYVTGITLPVDGGWMLG